MTAIWDVAVCSLVDIYGSFDGAYCLHHQDGEEVVSMFMSYGFLDEHRILMLSLTFLCSTLTVEWEET
jgi:hypothetical protein